MSTKPPEEYSGADIVSDPGEGRYYSADVGPIRINLGDVNSIADGMSKGYGRLVARAKTLKEGVRHVAKVSAKTQMERCVDRINDGHTYIERSDAHSLSQLRALAHPYSRVFPYYEEIHDGEYTDKEAIHYQPGIKRGKGEEVASIFEEMAVLIAYESGGDSYQLTIEFPGVASNPPLWDGLINPNRGESKMVARDLPKAIREREVPVIIQGIVRAISGFITRRKNEKKNK